MDWMRFKPGHWYQNYPTDLVWDTALNTAMDNARVVKLGHATVTIDGFEVWVANWPYAYGNLYAPAELKMLPKVATRYRLRNFVRNAAITLAKNKATQP